MCARAGLDRRQYPRPVLIKGYLTGHEFDLLTLADLFREGEHAVAVDDQGHYLSFSAPDELFHDGGGLYDAASRLLRQVNGVARAREGDFRPVGLTGHFSDETGQQHRVALADSAEVRGRAFHRPPCGRPPLRPRPRRSAVVDGRPDANAWPRHRWSTAAGHEPNDPSDHAAAASQCWSIGPAPRPLATPTGRGTGSAGRQKSCPYSMALYLVRASDYGQDLSAAV